MLEKSGEQEGVLRDVEQILADAEDGEAYKEVIGFAAFLDEDGGLSLEYYSNGTNIDFANGVLPEEHRGPLREAVEQTTGRSVRDATPEETRARVTWADDDGPLRGLPSGSFPGAGNADSLMGSGVVPSFQGFVLPNASNPSPNLGSTVGRQYEYQRWTGLAPLFRFPRCGRY